MKQYVTQAATVSQEHFLMTLDEVADNRKRKLESTQNPQQPPLHVRNLLRAHRVFHRALVPLDCIAHGLEYVTGSRGAGKRDYTVVDLIGV